MLSWRSGCNCVYASVMRLSRILLWGLLIIAAATVLLVAGSFIHPWFMPAQEEIIQIGVIAVLYMALALGCAVVMGRGRARALMGLSLIHISEPTRPY